MHVRKTHQESSVWYTQLSFKIRLASQETLFTTNTTIL